MDLQRQEYPSMLPQLQPGQAVKILYDRLNHIKAVNTEVADWLQERRRLEEQYVIGLRRLANRPLGGTPEFDLGIFTSPWQKIISYTETQAESHTLFSLSIERDVEKPLRDYTTSNRALLAMANVGGNLQAIARDLENAEKKADKLKDKGGKASVDKVATAASTVEDAKGQWESQAPYVFERLQEVDETRLEHLRSCLTQFQTLATETHSSMGTAAEEALNSLLNIRPADEIQQFATKAPTTVSTIPPVRERRMSRAPATHSTTSGAPSASTALSPPPIDEEAVSQRSNSFVQEKPKGKFSGLRRLGTVIKGRRNSTHPYGQQLTSPETKRSSTNLSKFSPFKRKETSDALSPDALERQQSTSRPSTRQQEEAGPSGGIERVPSHRSNAIQEIPEQKPEEELTNGTHSTEAAVETKPEIPNSQPEVPVAREIEPQNRGSDAITQAMQEAALVNDGSNSQFKVDILHAPIQEEASDSTAAVANVASALRSIGTPRRNPTVRGRRADRNTILVPSPSVPELQNQASASTSSLPTLPDAPSTAFSPSIAQPAGPQAPFKLAHRSTLAADESAASDTHSIRSARSLSSSVSATVKHPDVLDPGLNASVVETVSAWFTPEGSVTRAVQIGEVAFAYNPSIDAEGHEEKETEEVTIRFDGFGALEKVAPNPHFIDSLSEKGEGVYSLHLGKMSGHGGRMAVAFKYQVRLDASHPASEHVPLLLSLASKVDPGQTLVKLTYGLNEAFKFSTAENVALSGLVIILHMDNTGGKVTQCQASNGGTYSKEKHLVYWRLNDVTLPLVQTENQKSSQDLLLRFMTEGEVKTGNVEVRFEIVGERVPGSTGTGIGLSRMVESQSVAEIDPFADEDAHTSTKSVEWKEIHNVRRLRSGTYSVTAT